MNDFGLVSNCWKFGNCAWGTFVEGLGKVWVIILEYAIYRLQPTRLWQTLVVNFQTPMKEFPAWKELTRLQERFPVLLFNLPEPAVDGNVMGVLARLFEVNHDIGIPSNRKIFQAMMEILIDPGRPGDFNQALMDLGSDIEAPVNPRPEEVRSRTLVRHIRMAQWNVIQLRLPRKSLSLFILKPWWSKIIRENFYLKKWKWKAIGRFWHFPLIEVDDFSQEEQFDLFHQVAEEVWTLAPVQRRASSRTMT